MVYSHPVPSLPVVGESLHIAGKSTVPYDRPRFAFKAPTHTQASEAMPVEPTHTQAPEVVPGTHIHTQSTRKVPVKPTYTQVP